MPIYQQWNMIGTWFKNWYVQENKLYMLRNMGRGAYYSKYGMSNILKCIALYSHTFCVLPHDIFYHVNENRQWKLDMKVEVEPSYDVLMIGHYMTSLEIVPNYISEVCKPLMTLLWFYLQERKQEVEGKLSTYLQ